MKRIINNLSCKYGNIAKTFCQVYRPAINYATREVCVLGKPVKLTPIGYKLLCRLVKNGGSPGSQVNLPQSIWGPNYEADSEFLKKYIYRLCSKVAEDPAAPKMILTERGEGYMYLSSPYSPN